MLRVVCRRRKIKPMSASSRTLLPIVVRKMIRARWRCLRRCIRVLRRSWRSSSSAVLISGITCLLLMLFPL